jgi:hypothetical protein
VCHARQRVAGATGRRAPLHVLRQVPCAVEPSEGGLQRPPARWRVGANGVGVSTTSDACAHVPVDAMTVAGQARHVCHNEERQAQLSLDRYASPTPATGLKILERHCQLFRCSLWPESRFVQQASQKLRGTIAIVSTRQRLLRHSVTRKERRAVVDPSLPSEAEYRHDHAAARMIGAASGGPAAANMNTTGGRRSRSGRVLATQRRQRRADRSDATHSNDRLRRRTRRA